MASNLPFDLNDLDPDARAMAEAAARAEGISLEEWIARMVLRRTGRQPAASGPGPQAQPPRAAPPSRPQPAAPPPPPRPQPAAPPPARPQPAAPQPRPAASPLQAAAPGQPRVTVRIDPRQQTAAPVPLRPVPPQVQPARPAPAQPPRPQTPPQGAQPERPAPAPPPRPPAQPQAAGPQRPPVQDSRPPAPPPEPEAPRGKAAADPFDTVRDQLEALARAAEASERDEEHQAKAPHPVEAPRQAPPRQAAVPPRPAPQAESAPELDADSLDFIGTGADGGDGEDEADRAVLQALDALASRVNASERNMEGILNPLEEAVRGLERQLASMDDTPRHGGKDEGDEQDDEAAAPPAAARPAPPAAQPARPQAEAPTAPVARPLRPAVPDDDDLLDEIGFVEDEGEAPAQNRPGPAGAGAVRGFEGPRGEPAAVDLSDAARLRSWLRESERGQPAAHEAAEPERKVRPEGRQRADDPTASLRAAGGPTPAEQPETDILELDNPIDDEPQVRHFRPAGRDEEIEPTSGGVRLVRALLLVFFVVLAAGAGAAIYLWRADEGGLREMVQGLFGANPADEMGVSPPAGPAASPPPAATSAPEPERAEAAAQPARTMAQLPAPAAEPAPAPEAAALPAAQQDETPTLGSLPAGPPAGQVSPGRSAVPPPLPTSLTEGDIAAVAAQLKIEAQNGNAEAQHDLGVLYVEGCGVPQDPREAAHWFRESAIQGVANAQYNLGVLYERGLGVQPDRLEALLWYLSAAEQDHAPAQYNVGVAYAEGNGIEQNFIEARKWFEKAAGQGLARAQFNLGTFEEEGLTGARDPAAAYRYYRQAAMNGEPQAEERATALRTEIGAERAAALDGELASQARTAPPRPAATAPTQQPAAAPAAPAPVPAAPPGGSANLAQVREAQQLLNALGFDAGPADGIPGARTVAAIRGFEQAIGMVPTGEVSPALLDALRRTAGR